MAGRIIADDQMDTLRRRIIATCVELLWRQQPVAGELREVTAIHEMAIDLGIIDDQVMEIAKQAIRVAAAAANGDRVEYPNAQKIAYTTEAMLTDAMRAFEERNPDLAESVYARADEIEEAYPVVIEEIQARMEADPEAVGHGVSVLFGMTALQRIAERIENIAWHTEEML
jgi:phosphate transport system protein